MKRVCLKNISLRSRLPPSLLVLAGRLVAAERLKTAKKRLFKKAVSIRRFYRRQIVNIRSGRFKAESFNFRFALTDALALPVAHVFFNLSF